MRELINQSSQPALQLYAFVELHISLTKYVLESTPTVRCCVANPNFRLGKRAGTNAILVELIYYTMRMLKRHQESLCETIYSTTPSVLRVEGADYAHKNAVILTTKQALQHSQRVLCLADAVHTLAVNNWHDFGDATHQMYNPAIIVLHMHSIVSLLQSTIALSPEVARRLPDERKAFTLFFHASILCRLETMFEGTYAKPIFRSQVIDQIDTMAWCLAATVYESARDYRAEAYCLEKAALYGVGVIDRLNAARRNADRISQPHIGKGQKDGPISLKQTYLTWPPHKQSTDIVTVVQGYSKHTDAHCYKLHLAKPPTVKP